MRQIRNAERARKEAHRVSDEEERVRVLCKFPFSVQQFKGCKLDCNAEDRTGFVNLS